MFLVEFYERFGNVQSVLIHVAFMLWTEKGVIPSDLVQTCTSRIMFPPAPTGPN